MDSSINISSLLLGYKCVLYRKFCQISQRFNIVVESEFEYQFNVKIDFMICINAAPWMFIFIKEKEKKDVESKKQSHTSHIDAQRLKCTANYRASIATGLKIKSGKVILISYWSYSLISHLAFAFPST